MTPTPSPAWKALTVTTPAPVGSISRATSVCNAVTICAPTAIGSTVRWGFEAWPPWPWITMWNTVPGRHHGAGAETDDTDRQRLEHVQPERGVDRGIAQHPGLDHRQGAAGAGLLGRLEAELDRAGELVVALQQQARRGEEDRGVAVVAAGVHHAGVLRAVLDLVFFLDRQRVHVGPQQHGPAQTPCRQCPGSGR